ncbi:MAG: hypothetical protein MJ168_05535 [Clostridia bacterium]|nr:hypothetical protein [Clostridia bacterium]
MEYVKAMKTYEKMCDSMKGHCEKCPLACMNNPVNRSCLYFVSGHPELAEPILEQWDKGNPAKTRADKLREQYPNVRLDDNNIPKIFPCHIDKPFPCRIDMNEGADEEDIDCINCKKKYWLSEYEELPQKNNRPVLEHRTAKSTEKYVKNSVLSL